MKKSFFTAAGLMLFALAFSSCQKEPVESVPAVSEPNFTIFAQPSSETKTSNDGLNTKWSEGDAINVFHAAAGTTEYVSDGQFSLKDTESGKFDGTVSGLDSDASYDWYAFYPYSSYLKTSPNNTSESYCYIGSRSDKSQTQVGNDNMSHICGANYPLFGIVRDIKGTDTPSITMQHLTSVIKIVVTNSTDEELSINSVSFTAGEDIAGQFYIAFDSETPVYTPSQNASETANLTVSGVNVDAGAKGTVYMAVKPFTAKSGSTLKLSVNGYEKAIDLPSDVTFTAGHIRTLGFDYNKVAENYSGTYLLLNSDKTKVCPAFTSGKNNIPAVDYEADKIEDSWVMTIKKISGSSMYTIQDANGMYLSTGTQNNKNYLVGLGNADTKRSYWTISLNEDGSYSIVATKYSYSNILKYNSNSSLFACYTGGQKSVTLVEYTPLPALAKPVVEADVNTAKDGIDVVWSDVENATKYVVSCTGQADVEVVSGKEYASFTGLVVGQEYTVTVTASADGYKSATSDEVKVTMPDPRTPLATPEVEADATDVNSIYVMWQAVSGAKDYTVTCGNNTITTSETEYTFTGLAYSTKYTVSVVANPADDTINTPSAPGTATATTEANPSGETTITYQHIFTEKPSTGSLSGVKWTVEATNLGAYNSGNYAGVQFGTSKKSGSITLTSEAWSYKEKSKIKEVRIWLNAGSDIPTAAVKIGGKDAKSDGKTVQKNSSAKTYKDATMLTFTPVDGGNSGIVVINASTSSKAAYICAMEIDCF